MVKKCISKLLYILNLVLPKSESIVFIDSCMYKDNITALKYAYKFASEKKTFKKISTLVTFKKRILEEPIVGNVYYIHSLIGIFQVLRAKYIICDTMFGDDFITNKQIVVDIWHGVGLKKILGFYEYKDRKKPCANFATAYSEFFIPTIEKAFIINRDHVIVSPAPRTDFFYFRDSSIWEKIDIDCKKYKKIFIWMPTYRQSTRASSSNDGKVLEYGIPLLTKENIKVLDSVLSKYDFLLIIKHHSLQDKHKSVMNTLHNIKIITSLDIYNSNIPLYQYLGNCDGLLTDYSSVFFEFLCLDLPICFAYDDFEEYKSKRGFMFENPIDIMPGIHAQSFNDLISFFYEMSINLDTCANKRRNVRNILNIDNTSFNSLKLLQKLEIVRK